MAVLEKADDKRSSPRRETGAVVAYFPFSSRKVPAIAARVCNCSPEGLSFRSACPILPGQTICLIRQSTPEAGRTVHQAAALLRSFALAEVRWCLDAPDGEEGYRIGARYL
jgi:hypothetical protein